MQTTPIVPLKKRENPESYQIKNFAEYEALWKNSLENRNKFWTTTARRALDWHKDFTKVYSEKMDKLSGLLMVCLMSLITALTDTFLAEQIKGFYLGK